MYNYITTFCTIHFGRKSLAKLESYRRPSVLPLLDSHQAAIEAHLHSITHGKTPTSPAAVHASVGGPVQTHTSIVHPHVLAAHVHDAIFPIAPTSTPSAGRRRSKSVGAATASAAATVRRTTSATGDAYDTDGDGDSSRRQRVTFSRPDADGY
eukprot:Opistho-2@36837